MSLTHDTKHLTHEDKVRHFTTQYNARASIADHPQIFSRWQTDSALARRTHAGVLDIAFGESDGERLDFFPTTKRDAPLLVFIHGGWWRSLDKSDFTFVVPPYLAAGCNVALTNYTLAPHASLEEITRQQLRALAWLYRNADQYEFKRDHIIIAGHSAGAHLAAMMMAAQWPVFGDDLPADLIKGGILMSGLYDLDPIRYAEFVNVDLKITSENASHLSPGFMPLSRAIPFITAVGDEESDEFKRQTGHLAKNWQSSHIADVFMPAINHLTICDAFANEEHALYRASCKLIHDL